VNSARGMVLGLGLASERGLVQGSSEERPDTEGDIFAGAVIQNDIGEG